VRKGLEYLGALSHLTLLNRGNRHSIIHAHFFQLPPADILFLRGLKLLGSRVVITVHDALPYNPWPGQRLFSHLLYHLADRLIAHTNSIKTELVRTFHLPESRIAVIPHGNYVTFTDSTIPHQKAREALALADSRPVILFFGQIRKGKGLDYLIKSHRHVLEAFPQATLIIAGRPWRESFVPYESLIRELGIDHAIQCRIEYIPDREIPFYFQSADIVALPYTRVYSSGVLQLAMSYGKPIVATDVEGLAEVVDNGQSALLVPPENEEELAKAIIHLLSNPEVAAKMGRCARRMSEERFGWEGIAEATEQVYAGALGDGR